MPECIKLAYVRNGSIQKVGAALAWQLIQNLSLAWLEVNMIEAIKAFVAIFPIWTHIDQVFSVVVLCCPIFRKFTQVSSFLTDPV